MKSFLFDNTWIFLFCQKKPTTCSAWICTLKFLIILMHILGFFYPYMALLGASCLSISEICPSYTIFVLSHPYNEPVSINFWWENLPPTYTFKVQISYFVLTLLDIWFQKTFQILYLLTISELHKGLTLIRNFGVMWLQSNRNFSI